MAQSEFYISVQDALGQPVSDVNLKAMQDGKELALEGQQFAGGYFLALMDPHKAICITATHPDYTIDGVNLEPPHATFSRVLSAGRAGDAALKMDGARHFFQPHPELIAVVPTAEAWQNNEKKQALADWEKKFELIMVESPWPAPDQLGDETDQGEIIYFYTTTTNSAFPASTNAALEAIRATDLATFAGIPIWPGAILGHSFLTESLTAKQKWLDKHKLIVVPPQSKGEKIRIIAPPEMGHGILELHHKIQECGKFNNPTPAIYTLLSIG